MGRLSMRAPLFLLVPVFTVAVLGGFVASALATGPGPFRAAQPGEPTYLLTDMTVEVPYRGMDGVVDDSKAGIGYDITWSTASYPGAAECEIRVLDAEGTVIGSDQYEFVNLEPKSLDQRPLPVSVDGVPASAEGECAAAAPESGNYRISNPIVETDEDGATNLIADIAFGNSGRPGVGACTAFLTLPGGVTTNWAFTIQVPEGRMVIASLGSDFEGASVQSVSCGPYATAEGLARRDSA